MYRIHSAKKIAWGALKLYQNQWALLPKGVFRLSNPVARHDLRKLWKLHGAAEACSAELSSYSKSGELDGEWVCKWKGEEGKGVLAATVMF